MSIFIIILLSLYKINFSKKNEKHEEIKTWVISISMNGKIDPSLNIDERGFYEASLIVPGGVKFLPCVITGNTKFSVFSKKNTIY